MSQKEETQAADTKETMCRIINSGTHKKIKMNLPSDSIATGCLFHDFVFLQEAMIGPKPKENLYQCHQDICAKPQFLSESADL